MKGDDGKVLIQGYYDGIEFDAQAREVMQAVPDDEAALRKRLGIAKAETVGRNYQEAMQYPSLNVRGLQSAEVGSRSEEHTSELQSPCNLVCRLLLEKKKKKRSTSTLIASM